VDESTVEELYAARQPADVIQAAGSWLSAELADIGLVWLRSRQDLTHKAKLRTDRIHLQSSTRNRTDDFVRFDAVLTAHDRGLAAWRRINPGLTANPSPHRDQVASIMLGTLLKSHPAGGVVLTDRALREQRLVKFADDIRTAAFPWFDAVSSISDLDAIPPATLDWSAVDLVELLISRGEPAKARSLVEYWLGLGDHRPEAYQQGREDAEQGIRPGATRRAHLVGWSTAVLGLF